MKMRILILFALVSNLLASPPHPAKAAGGIPPKASAGIPPKPPLMNPTPSTRLSVVRSEQQNTTEQTIDRKMSVDQGT